MLRGFVVAVLLFRYGPLGEDHLRDPFGWLVVLAMIVLSVRVGPISHRLPRWLRYGLGAAVTLLVTVMVINLVGIRPSLANAVGSRRDANPENHAETASQSRARRMHDVDTRAGVPLAFRGFPASPWQTSGS